MWDKLKKKIIFTPKIPLTNSCKIQNKFMFRLGWGSGYNSSTINLAKNIPESKVSRRLIRNEYPLGWVKGKIAV